MLRNYRVHIRGDQDGLYYDPGGLRKMGDFGKTHTDPLHKWQA